MNKRIKRKHATKENKNMMESTLTYLKTLGLTPYDIEYPDSYCLFMNEHSHEMMEFKLKELPNFLFGVWYKDLYLKHPDRTVKLPIIFGERLSILDKFKPSRAEWSPLYNNYIDKNLEYDLSEYWSTLRLLPDFVKAPWRYIPYESEEEFQKLENYFELEAKYIEEVLKSLYTKVEHKLKELNIPLGILAKDNYWSHKNLYLIFEEGTQQEQIDLAFEGLYNFVQFDLGGEVEDVIHSLKCRDYVNGYEYVFNWHLDYYWIAKKETLKKAKSMNFMEMNKEFKEMNLKGSNFTRLIGE